MTFEINREQLIDILEDCSAPCSGSCKKTDSCPFSAECLFYFTGEKCGSQLEQE